MSQKYHRKHFSKDGFWPLQHSNTEDMINPNDVTIDMPMTTVTSRGRTSARKADNMSPTDFDSPSDFPDTTNEKQGRFRRGPGGRRRKIAEGEEGDGETDDGTFNAVGKIYNKIYNFSVITRYILYVAPVAGIIAIPIVVGATVGQDARIGGVRLNWFFTWIEVVWISLWVSKLVSQFLPYLFQFLCGYISSGTRKYAMVLSALEIPLSLVGWAVTSLTTFVPLMTLNPDNRRRGDTSVKHWESIVQSILAAAVFSTLVLFGEKLIIQLISISYHRKQFYDKIKTSKQNIHFISLLYDASRSLFPAYCSEFAEEDYLISAPLDLGRSRGTGKHARSGSVTPLRFIQNVNRIGDKVTAAFGNVAQEITGKQVFNPTAAHSIVVEALERKRSSEALARRIWMSFVMEGKDALHLEDIVDVLGPQHSDEAEECFECLDADGNGDISLEEMILRTCAIGRDRSSIANSMHDVDQAINVLDKLLCAVVFIVTVLIFVAFLNKSFVTTLATTGTALLSLSFVFSVTAQEVLGSCIFLFVKHPFDVGDRVDIGDVQLVVERISLLYTLFRKVKDHKKTQVPNIVLNSVWIDNISRSGAMREQVLLSINFDTTLEDIQLLKSEMTKFVLDKENSRDFQPNIDVEVTGVAEMNKLELKVEIRHKSNWANEAVRAARRSKFMCALVLALRQVPIYGPGAGMPPAGDAANPTYSVYISDEQAVMNKKDFSDVKEKKRMIPVENKTSFSSSSIDSDTVGKSSAIDMPPSAKFSFDVQKEMAFADRLNVRSPAVDPQIRRNDDSRERGPSTADTDAVTDASDLTRFEAVRNKDIDGVRDLLRRQSTLGRRKATQQNALSPQGSSSSNVPRIVEPPPLQPNVPVTRRPLPDGEWELRLDQASQLIRVMEYMKLGRRPRLLKTTD